MVVCAIAGWNNRCTQTGQPLYPEKALALSFAR